jgi:hypothetical protein
MTTYCPQLGTTVEFTYCAAMSEGLPCRNLPGCWKERIDIPKYLAVNFTPEQLRKVFEGAPKTRIERMLESIRRAKEED